MNSPISLVAGGTGLVGSHIVKILSKKQGTQIILARSFDSDIPENGQLKIINFDDLNSGSVQLESSINHVYLCLGKKLSSYELGYMQYGSRESFKLIDYQYPLSIAKLAYKSGARSISLVSAVGAHEGSFNYYFHIKGKLENKIKEIGFEKTNDLEKTDCYILNTCHIRDKAKEKVYHEIGRVKKNFRSRKKPIVIVAGCVAQAENEEMIKREPYIDIVIGPQAYHKINEKIEEFLYKQKKIDETEFDAITKFDYLDNIKNSSKKISSFLTIQEGCDKFCHFCVVPFTRGLSLIHI